MEDKVNYIWKKIIDENIMEDNKLITKILNSESKINKEDKLTIDNILLNLKTKENINDEPKIKEKKKITRGFLEGCFDVTHSGHYNAIRQAKKLVDYLIVGINSDEEILKYKGSTIMNQNERYEIAKGCKWVDEIIVGIPYVTTLEYLDSINCDYILHGDDICYDKGKNIFQEFIDAGRMKIFKRTEGISTTNILGRLLTHTKDHIIKKNKDISSNNDLLKDISFNNEDRNLIQTTRRIKEFSNNSVPKEGDKIVYIAGSFDIFHHGHINLLKKAKELGDYLIVGLYSDETIHSNAGKNYPIINLNERILCALSNKYIDDIIIGPPLKINEYFINQLKINIVAEPLNCTGYDKDFKEIYDYPLSINIVKKIKSDFDFNIFSITERIFENNNHFISKIIKKSKGENEYYEKDNNVREI